MLDGSMLDGSMLDGSMFGGSMFGGSMFGGSMLDGSMLDGSVLDGSMLDGSMFVELRLFCLTLTTYPLPSSLIFVSMSDICIRVIIIFIFICIFLSVDALSPITLLTDTIDIVMSLIKLIVNPQFG